MVLEWVAECSWNRWPDVSGMGGRMFMESVAEWVWNTQLINPNLLLSAHAHTIS